MAYGKLGDFFSKIRDGQAPEQFTNQLLKDLGFKSTNHRPYVAILKELGFLTADGKPTQRYSDYRDHSRSAFVVGDGLKEAYSDIFLIKENPTSSDKDTVTGKFKSFHNVSDNVAKNMASTFFALLDLADLSGASQSTSELPATEPITEPATATPSIPLDSLGTGLHYNIQIHLPATKDVEVYNAIFKSLKEHLY